MRATRFQENLYADLALSTNKSKYNLVYPFKVIDNKGVFNVDRFISSWKKLLVENSVFNLSFILDDDNNLVQKFHRNKNDFSIEYINISNDCRDLLLEKLIEEGLEIKFDLSSPPLWHLKILRQANVYYIRFVFSHIITDAMSLRIIFNKLSDLYNSELDISVVNQEFNNDLLLQKYLESSETFEHSDQFQLAGEFYSDLVKGKSLRFHFNREVDDSVYYQRVYDKIDDVLWDNVLRQSETFGCTPFVLLLTSFVLYISRYFQESRVSLGYPIGKRPQGLEALLGYFVNVFPIIVDLQERDTFFDVLKKIMSIHSNNLKYRQFDQKHLKKIYRDNIQDTLDRDFDVVFSSTILDSCDLRLSGCETSMVLPDIGIPQANLITYIDLSSRSICLEFDKTKTSIEVAKEFLKSFKYFVSQVSGETKYNSFSLVRDELPLYDREQGRISEFQSIVDLFSIQVLKNPEHPAITFNEFCISYDKLNTYSDDLALKLEMLGVKKNDVVAICLPKCADFFVAILAIMKVGAIYLPIDINAPIERINKILKTADVKFLFLSKIIERKLKGLNYDGRNICIDLDELSGNTNIGKNISWKKCYKDDPAYIIFTSGSTGEPKGVLINHGGLANLAKVQGNIIGVNQNKRVLAFAPVYFDASVSEWVTTLAYGGTLVVPDNISQQELSANLIDICNNERINVVTLPPSVISLLVPKDFRTLDTVLVAGEAMQKGVIDDWCDDVKLFNAYGPTEGTVCSTMKHILSKDVLSSNVGKPIEGVEVFVLDRYLKQLPLGAIGEICLGGVCLSNGYVNNIGQTSKSFVSVNAIKTLYKTGDLGCFDDNLDLHVLGREDSQIKIRGN
ncbi:MAG: amino acid adenylation domain-containing protein, partial [Alphaproteobacteria bacterium]|nr:amino acid adenylation domain-containing protein [Alphaproteobacteria bacterium]